MFTAEDLTAYTNEQENDGFEIMDIPRWAVASTIDLAATLTDSLAEVATLGYYDSNATDTTTWLNSFDDMTGMGVSDFYEDNQELVNMTSFIGGILVPGTAIAKGIRAAQKGSVLPKIFRRFETAKQVNSARAVESFQKYGETSLQYQAAMKAVRNNTLAQGFGEAVAMEIGFIGTMNGHAYMENDYSPMDFAIGVAIGGSLGAGLNWIVKNKEVKNLVLDADIAMKKHSKEGYGVLHAAETKGHALSFKSLSFTALDNMDVSQFSTDELAKISTLKVHELKESKDIIRGMMSKDLFAREGFDFRGSSKQRDIVYDVDYPMEKRFVVSPATMLNRMNFEQRGVFSGVQRFDDVNLDNMIDDAYIDEVYLSRQQGEFTAIDGETAIDAFAPGWTLEGAKKIDIPDTFKGATVRMANEQGRAVVLFDILDHKVGDSVDFKRWFAGTIAKEEYEGFPIRVRSRNGRLEKVTRERIKSKLNADEEKITERLNGIPGVSPKGFVPPHETAELRNGKFSDFGVVIPYFGHHIMPGSLARYSMPAAADASVQINKRANAATKWKFELENLRTQDADGLYIQARYIVNNDTNKRLLKETINSKDLPRFQAAVMELEIATYGKDGKKVFKAGQKIPVIKLEDGTELNFDAARRKLVEEKAAFAEEVIGKGGTIEQAALYTNMELDDIEKLVAARFVVDDQVASKLKTMVYTEAAGTPEDFLKAKPIRALGRHRRYAQLEELKATQILDRETAESIHAMIIRNNIDTKGSTEFGELLENTVWAGTYKHVLGNVEKVLSTAVKPMRFYTSADQSLRWLGDVGDDISAIGNAFLATTNKQLESMGKKLLPRLKALALKQEDVLQFEHVRRAVLGFAEEGKRLELAGDKIKIVGGPAGEPEKFLKYHNTSQDLILSENMQDFMSEYMDVSRRMLNDQNVLRRNANLPDLNDRGIWFPYESLDDKFIAFKVGKDGDPHNLEIIIGKSAKDLEEQISNLRQNPDVTAGFDIVTRDEIGYWSDLLDTATLNPIKRADSSFKKSGITTHMVKPDASGLNDLMDQLIATRWRTNRLIMKQAGAPLFQRLEAAAGMKDEVVKSSKGTVFQKAESKPGFAEIAYSTMLNTTLMRKSPFMQYANDVTTAKINQALTKSRELWDDIRGGSKDTPEAYAEFGRKATEAGIPLPWRNFEEYLQARNRSKISNQAEHRIAQINGISTFLNLRLMDLSHAAVTLLSTPVILSAQLANKKLPMKVFMDTAAWMMKGGEEYQEIMKRAKKLGYTESIVSETSAMMRDLHVKKELPVNFSKIGDMLATPSDWAERATREFTYAMGYQIAKGKGITDPARLEAAAGTFVLRSMGNYISRQRPTMFQGSFGSIIGLYQTFMLTMGQNIYRYIEDVDKKAMGYLLGAQAGMFGIESLPFYHPFNRLLGEYYSDENENITTTGYRVAGDNAEYALYGLPSALLQTGFYTRAELQPRTAFNFQEGIGLKPAGYSNIEQAITLGWDMVNNVGNSIRNDGSAGDWRHAMAQSFAAQSIWRPGARAAELYMGRSFDQKGQLIQGPDDVWGWDSWVARSLASRPLKESLIRQHRFNGTYFQKADQASRQKVTRQIRRAAAFNRDMSGEEYDALMNKYLEEGGSLTGWSRAVKSSYMEADVGYAAIQAKRLKNQEGWMDVLQEVGAD